MNQGFLGTAASRSADLVLLLEMGMGVALVAGAVLARRKMFRAHAGCQSAVVLLNLAVVALLMVPSFREQVAPRIPEKLGKAYYGLAAVHAAIGSTAEVAALYILLAAGAKVLPPRLRISRYKLWMRAVLGLWWLTLGLGAATYARWYLPGWFRH